MSLETDTPIVRQMFDDVTGGRASAVHLARQYDVLVPPEGFPLRGRDDVRITALPGARLNLFCREPRIDCVFPLGNLRRAIVEPFYAQVYDQRSPADRAPGKPAAVRAVLDLSTIAKDVGSGYSSRCRIGPVVLECNRAVEWAITLGGQSGWRDVNNEWHQLDGVEANNYLFGAWYQQGSQAKEERITSPKFNGNTDGKVGNVGIYVNGGTVNVDGIGRIGGHREGDVVLRRPDGGEPMRFTGWNSEGSARMLVVYPASRGCQVELAGVRWAHNGLHPDGAAIVLGGPISLELHASQLGDNDKQDAAGNLVVPRIRIEHQAARLDAKGITFGARGASAVDPIDYRVAPVIQADADADIALTGAEFYDQDYVPRRVPAFERVPRWARQQFPCAPQPDPPGPRPMRDPALDDEPPASPSLWDRIRSAIGRVR